MGMVPLRNEPVRGAVVLVVAAATVVVEVTAADELFVAGGYRDETGRTGVEVVRDVAAAFVDVDELAIAAATEDGGEDEEAEEVALVVAAFAADESVVVVAIDVALLGIGGGAFTGRPQAIQKLAPSKRDRESGRGRQ
jgi:hypothetical protein